ncbi:hypothetical protein AVEN_75463-1, partial [Araneus ventricosus]
GDVVFADIRRSFVWSKFSSRSSGVDVCWLGVFGNPYWQFVRVEVTDGPKGSAYDVLAARKGWFLFGPVGSWWEWHSEGRRCAESDDYGHVSVST